MATICREAMRAFLPLCLIIFSTIAKGSEISQHPQPWWSKPISRDISTAGCLTRSQIEEVQKAGFKSIISMFNTDMEETIGTEEYPSTNSARAITDNLGLKYAVILQPGEYDWMCLETLETFSNVFPLLPKPVLFHCMSSYSASFISLLYYVNETKNRPFPSDDLALSLNAQAMLTQAAAMGFDYSLEEAPLEMLREISGQGDLNIEIKPDLTQPYWNFGFWSLKPIAHNWYTLGALRLNQLQALKDNDIDTIISLNPGPKQTPHGHVAKDGSKDGNEKAERTKLHRPILNMECKDLDGGSVTLGTEVNEEAERLAARNSGLQYIYAPLESESVSLSDWQRIRPLVLTAGIHSKGVLLHGKWPRTTVVIGLLAAGCQLGRDSRWAIDRLSRHGYFPPEPREGSTGSTWVSDERQGSQTWLTFLWREYLSPIVNTLGLDYLHTLKSEKYEGFSTHQLFKAVLDHREVMCKI